MSEHAADTEPFGDAEDLAERVELWLTRELPIIQMHGGTSTVREADPETGEVVVELGGGSVMGIDRNEGGRGTRG